MNNETQIFNLKAYEKVLTNYCRLGDCLVMSTSFLKNDSNYKLNQDLVLKALVYMQKRHPFLNAHLENHFLKNQVCLKIPHIPNSNRISIEWLDLRVSQVTRQIIINESAKYFSKKFDFDSENLQWKIQIIEYLKEDNKVSYVMNLVVNMLISDGLSITCLSGEIVNILNALIDQRECDEMRIHLKPVDSLHDLCQDLYEKNKKMKSVNDKNVAKLILPDKFRSNKPGYLLDLFKLDKELVDKIISKSKMNNIRLSGYFHTVTLYALRRLFIENDELFPSSVPISFPVNLRFRLEPPVDLNACRFFTAVCECSTEREKFGNYENFWEDAKYVHDLIQEHSNPITGSLFNETHHKFLEVFNQVCILTGTSQKTLKILNFFHPTKCDLNVSNLGKYVNDFYKEFDGKFSIREIYCSDLLTSIPRLFSSIVMHIIFWKGDIMFQTGANNYYLDEKYFKRLNELILLMINETLDLN